MHRHGGIELQVCRHCSGVWLTREQIASRCVKHEALPTGSRRKLATEPKHETTKRVCSQCRVPLKPRIVEAVEIDLCPKCGGLWLDAGEFDAVHRWYMAAGAGSTGDTRANKIRLRDVADGAAHGADAIGGGLGEIVEFLCHCGGALLEGL